MHPNDDFLSAPELDFDGFRAAMRETWGWFTPAREANIFASKVRTRRALGFAAVDLICNATRLERTALDIRRDNMEYYYVTVQDIGESVIMQNDRVVKIAAGDVVLLDSTRPVTFISPAQDRDGLVCKCRGRTWRRISASRRRVVRAVAGRRKRHVCSINSLLTPPAMENRHSRRPTNLCVWWSMISSAHYSRRPRQLAHATPTNCLVASAALSRTALPIRISLRVRWPPRWEFRCAICRACSRTAGRHAVTTYLRAAWITRRI